MRKLHRQRKAEIEKALDEIDVDDVLENGTEAAKHVVGKAYEQTHVGDPMTKSVEEVAKAADELDRYVNKKRLEGEMQGACIPS